MNRTNKVVVAMSGGVDSSVSAALLKEQGYDVTGVFIKVWYPDFLPCNWKEEARDAERVAMMLDIPFHIVDFSAEYKEHVADYLVAEYKAGRTPNPDIMCNKWVKFGALVDWAHKHGIETVATGHYAQTRIDEDGVAHLLMGADKEKDQTYFLWTLTQDVLRHTLFPIGSFQKSDVRKLAAEHRLPVAEKKDSQGVCFLGHLDMREFLEHFHPSTQGDVLDTEGRVIGVHDGAVPFTLGQRHGFRIIEMTPSTEPHYVVAKDLDKNTITVATQGGMRESYSTKEIALKDINWIAGVPKTNAIAVRFRYRQSLFTAQYLDGEPVNVLFSEKHTAVSSGQSLVAYHGDECLGGGVIA